MLLFNRLNSNPEVGMTELLEFRTGTVEQKVKQLKKQLCYLEWNEDCLKIWYKSIYHR